MKTVLVGALCLLLGLAVGGLGPRAELQRTRKELAEAREAAASASGAGLLPALGLGGLAAARDRAQSRAPVPRFNPPEKTPEAPDPAVPRDPQRPPDQPRERRRMRLFGKDGEGFAAAKAAADLRAAQFRSAFIAEARLSPEKQNALDGTLSTMNTEFAKAASEIADDIARKGKAIRPRDMADVGVKLLDIYRRADDAMKAGLDDAGRAALEKTNFDPLTQVDMDAFRKLAETIEGSEVAAPGQAP
jgi:hypothetical protein